MKIVADASAFVAVAMDESSKAWIVRSTEGRVLLAPGSLRFEIGNALVSLVKKRFLDSRAVGAVWKVAASIPVEIMDVDLGRALELATARGLYAYDGYVLQCAVESNSPILTLDRRLARDARKIGLQVSED